MWDSWRALYMRGAAIVVTFAEAFGISAVA
jgi:hypothetical protein